jgi:1-acyl-sn-glycerol-3-phosphate acyltransferase
MRRIVDWLFTLPFLAVFGSVLLVFDPLQRLARLFGERPQERVRPWTPYLIVANHQSMFDIPIFGGLLFTNFPKYVSKKSLARWIPSISYNLRRGGHALIDRSDRDQALQAIRALGRAVCARGVSAVIYPEGTRARAGELGEFRPGGFLELLDAAPEVAVLPVTIDNSWKLLRHNLLPVPFGTRVRVRVGDPIARSVEEDRLALLQRTREEIGGTLRRWRAI